MGDNVVVTAGTGTTVAADEVVDGTLGTVKVQFVKIMDGTLDSTNKLVINSAGQMSVASAPATTPTISKVASVSGAPAAVSVKGSAGTLKGVNLYCNNGTVPIFIHFYNIASGGVTVGTSVPAFTIGVPPGDNFAAVLGDGAAFSTAISYAITGGIADNDATAVAVNDLVGVITSV